GIGSEESRTAAKGRHVRRGIRCSTPDESLLQGLLHVKRGDSEMVRPTNAYEADPCGRSKFDRLFHGTGADDRPKTVVAVDESGGRVGCDYARMSAGIYGVLANALGIDGKANHPVRIDSAQIGHDQTVGNFACVFAGHIQFSQYRTTELVQIFGPEALPFRHW